MHFHLTYHPDTVTPDALYTALKHLVPDLINTGRTGYVSTSTSGGDKGGTFPCIEVKTEIVDLERYLPDLFEGAAQLPPTLSEEEFEALFPSLEGLIACFPGYIGYVPLSVKKAFSNGKPLPSKTVATLNAALREWHQEIKTATEGMTEEEAEAFQKIAPPKPNETFITDRFEPEERRYKVFCQDDKDSIEAELKRIEGLETQQKNYLEKLYKGMSKDDQKKEPPVPWDDNAWKQYFIDQPQELQCALERFALSGKNSTYPLYLYDVIDLKDNRFLVTLVPRNKPQWRGNLETPLVTLFPGGDRASGHSSAVFEKEEKIREIFQKFGIAENPEPDSALHQIALDNLPPLPEMSRDYRLETQQDDTAKEPKKRRADAQPESEGTPEEQLQKAEEEADRIARENAVFTQEDLF